MKETKIVYITGCLGFIGSHITQTCLEKGWKVIGVDSETYAANLDLKIKFAAYNNQFRYIKSDINDLEMIVDCDAIINTAAESHVDNSITSSDKFLKTNILGVKKLLDLTLSKKSYKMPLFIQFSTDEVYGDILEGSHTEQDTLKPSNPYAATKASADMIILSYARTFKLNYLILRPTNNYGINQSLEKLIPRTIKQLSLGKQIELHEKGNPIRTWLHAQDTSDAVIKLIESNIKNEILNISSKCEFKNIDVVNKIKNILMKLMDEPIEDYIDFSFKREGQDIRYSIDDTKIRKLIDWDNSANFDDSLESIVKHYYSRKIW